jgi:ZIP family zinc transporter/zinc and cadmium transporter
VPALHAGRRLTVSPFELSLLLGAVAGLADFVGGALVTARRRWDRTFLQYFLALGAGFMLAVAFLRMVPESLEQVAHPYLYVLIGYFAVHLTEHTLTPHFHFGEEVHPDALVHPAVGYLGLAGLAIHTFFDGVAIASGFLISRPLGVVLFLAVLLHKLPEGFAVGSLMLAAGGSRRTALLAAGMLGLATIAGVLLTHLFSGVVGQALALSAGVTIYVAASDLIPEVNRERRWGVALAVFGGLLLYYVAETALDVVGLQPH